MYGARLLIMRKSIATILLSSSLLLQLQAELVRISVSDLLSDLITEPLQSSAVNDGLEFKINGVGSMTALDRLRAGLADIAIVAIPDSDVLPLQEFTVEPFAYDSAIIGVHRDHPLNEVTLSQLGGIFGERENYNYTTWDQLDLPDWNQRGIKTMVSPDASDISLELFKHSVLKVGELKTSVAVVAQARLEALIESDLNSIAVFSGWPQSPMIKALQVAAVAEAPAYGPTASAIYYGDYPIRLPFYLVYRSNDVKKLSALIHILYGNEIAKLLEHNQLFSLPAGVRQGLLSEL